MPRHRALSVTVAVLLALSLAEPAANACLNEVRGTDEVVRIIRDAERELERQDFSAARTKAATAHRLGGAEPGLRDRALRVHALATIRDPRKERPDKESIQDVTSAVANLEALARATPLDVTLQIDLAEALEHDPATHGRAVEILRPLAQKDLIGSAYAYAALGRLEKAQGRSSAAAEAQARCERTAVQPSMCRGKKPSAPWFRAPGWSYACFGLLAALFTLWQVLSLRRPVFRRLPAQLPDVLVHIAGVATPVLTTLVAPTWPRLLLAVGVIMTVGCAGVAHSLRVQTLLGGRVRGLRLRRWKETDPPPTDLPLLLERAEPDLVLEEITAVAGSPTPARRVLGRIGARHGARGFRVFRGLLAAGLVVCVVMGALASLTLRSAADQGDRIVYSK